MLLCLIMWWARLLGLTDSVFGHISVAPEVKSRPGYVRIAFRFSFRLIWISFGIFCLSWAQKWLCSIDLDYPVMWDVFTILSCKIQLETRIFMFMSSSVLRDIYKSIVWMKQSNIRYLFQTFLCYSQFSSLCLKPCLSTRFLYYYTITLCRNQTPIMNRE